MKMEKTNSKLKIQGNMLPSFEARWCIIHTLIQTVYGEDYKECENKPRGNIIQYKRQCLTYADDGVVLGLAMKYIAGRAEDMTQQHRLVWP